MIETDLPATENQLDRLRTLAERFDCITETDLMLLAKATAATVETWRKRGIGPSYIRIGNRVLYPCSSVAEYMDSLKRERRTGEREHLL